MPLKPCRCGAVPIQVGDRLANGLIVDNGRAVFICSECYIDERHVLEFWQANPHRAKAEASIRQTTGSK